MLRFTRVGGAAVVAMSVVFLLAPVLALSAPADNNKPAKNRKGRKDKAAPAPQAAFGDDLDQVDTTCGLTEIQKKRFEQAKTQRDKELGKFDADMAPKLAKIEQRLGSLDAKSKDQKVVAARKQLEAIQAQIVARREAIAQGHVRKMFALLTADQKAKWNGPLLTEEMSKEFALLMLEPKQIEQLDGFCARQARVLTFPVDPARPDDKRLGSTKFQIYKTILTPAQQAQYRRLKTPAPADKGGKNKKAGKA